MRSSLKAAAAKRPDLRKLTFCIPYDLADDPSRARGKQARERFEEAKARWRKFAPDVAIDLLSAGELLERLAREQHRGREWFFFGARIMGSEWCATELKGTIEDAGDRYTPQQNVDLPIDRILEAVVQPSEFQEQLRGRVETALRKGRELLKRSGAESRWSDALDAVKEPVARLEHERLIEDQPPRVVSASALKHVDDALHRLDELTDALRPIAWPERPDRTSKQQTAAERTALAERERAAASAQVLWRNSRDFEGALFRLRSFLTGPIVQAAERRALFVQGPAGRGKTHLFCDVGERLLNAGHPVIVLLGERFRESSPWKTLASLLGEPNLSPDETATVLAASGEASGRRAALFIDAINEASDPTMWSSELADMRRRLTASGWVGFSVSCRSTYLDLVEPQGGPDEEFARVDHLGYRGREFEATQRIFEAHGVQQPRVPLLLPEFSDPLFLKLYCEGIKGDPNPPSGGDHLSAVFERFVGQRSARVERRLRLDARLQIIQKAIDAFAEALAESGIDRLPYEKAQPLINGFAPHLQVSPETLIEAMASEGLLAIDRGWIDAGDERGEVVSFPYQRFSDHLVLRALLEKQLPTDAAKEVTAAFAADQPLGQWLADAPGGLIEALAIQMPEKWGIELQDLLPEPEHDDWRARYALGDASQAFISSLVVRDRAAFGPRTHELINEELNRYPEEMADALISVAPDPDHPYNGARLHQFLASLDMSSRDAYWTRTLYDAFGDPGHALDRLVRWAARGPYASYPPEVVELACIPLVWLLASPNRHARDYTTKALATLLTDRPAMCGKLVDRFAEIDDPYVRQRLAAAVLGAVTRSQSEGLDRATASMLLDALLSKLVESSTALPDILLRDHIASLARWLRRRSLIPPRLLARASPPYESKTPKTPRRTSYLEETYPRSDQREDGYDSLLSSALSSHSDWSRYVVSGRVDDFLPVTLGDPVPEPEEPKAESLWRIDQRAWKRFLRSLQPEQLAIFDLEEDKAVGQLLQSLDADQRALLDDVYIPRKRRRKPALPRMAFPPERASRFIFQRCIELGWTPKKFAQVDWSIEQRDRGRDAHKAERFGKKYQWIAFFELMARLSDNFTLHDWGRIREYEGAWILGLRDIDPTLRPERIEVGDDQEHVHSPTFPVDQNPAWWSPRPPTFEQLEPGQESAWAELQADLPTPEALLCLTDPNGARWVVVSGHHSWRDDPDEAPSVTAEAGPDRDLAILSLGAVIRLADLPRLRRWLGKYPDLLRALPDWGFQGIYDAFWAELPDESAAHGYPSGWRRRGYDGRIPVRSVGVSLGYRGEDSGYDCSLTTSGSVDMPSTFIRNLAGAQWNESGNVWRDSQDRPFAQYRETDEGFHRDRAFLLSEPALMKLFAENELALVIGLFCERRVFDRSASSSVPDALGWVDYVGNLILDGDEWSSSELQPIDRRARQHVH